MEESTWVFSFLVLPMGQRIYFFSSYVIVYRNKTRFLQGAEIKYVSTYSKEDILL